MTLTSDGRTSFAETGGAGQLDATGPLMELQAMASALQGLSCRDLDVCLATGSDYVAKALARDGRGPVGPAGKISGYAGRWAQNGWKRLDGKAIEHTHLWQTVVEELQRLQAAGNQLRVSLREAKRKVAFPPLGREAEGLELAGLLAQEEAQRALVSRDETRKVGV